MPSLKGKEAMQLLSGISSIKCPGYALPSWVLRPNENPDALVVPDFLLSAPPLVLISRASWVVLAGSARRVQLLIKADRNLRCYSPTVIWV